MATTAVRVVSPAVHVKRTIQCRPAYTIGCFVASDALSLVLSVAFGVCLKGLFHGHIDVNAYLRLWPYLGAFLFVFAAVGLYPGIAITPPDELKRSLISMIIVFFALAAETVTLRGGAHVLTPVLLVAVMTAVFLLPLFRAVVRTLVSTKQWWGCPAVIMGTGAVAQSVVETLKANPGLGLKPVAVIEENSRLRELSGVPVFSPRVLAEHLMPVTKYTYAIVPKQDPASSMESDQLAKFEEAGIHFNRLLYITEIVDSLCLWVTPRTIGAMLGLEVRHGHLMTEMLLAKRLLDLALTSIAAAVFLPLFVLLCVAIRLDSRGPIFFGHQRIGRNGKMFRAWKFRSMVPNGDVVLKEYLAKNPAARAEWEQDQKLKDDPRVTRVGRVLRKLSLDEIPQLWNVLMGEMSLVGPRPIVQSEVAKYGEHYGLYTKVSGGLTGLWQVSGRNETSYAERVRLDTFYVRNWSVWLDLCILFRTIGVVLLRKGAY